MSEKPTKGKPFPFKLACDPADDDDDQTCNPVPGKLVGHIVGKFVPIGEPGEPIHTMDPTDCPDEPTHAPEPSTFDKIFDLWEEAGCFLKHIGERDALIDLARAVLAEHDRELAERVRDACAEICLTYEGVPETSVANPLRDVQDLDLDAVLKGGTDGRSN